jgi:hypothetical protein
MTDDQRAPAEETRFRRGLRYTHEAFLSAFAGWVLGLTTSFLLRRRHRGAG